MVALTAVAVGSLVGGSWLVVSAATASPARPAVPAGSGLRGVAASTAQTAQTAVSGKAADVSPGAPSTGATTAAASSAVVAASTAPAVAPPTAPATTAAAPVVPTTLRPSPAVTAQPATSSPPRSATARARGGSAPPGTGAEASAARGLITAIDERSIPAVPMTADNVTLLERWMANEGGLWADNPLNTSLDAGRYPHEYTSTGGDTGEPIFPSMSVGLAATATTLLSNPSYGRIVALLRSGHPSCLSFARAVIRSPWASSHYEHNTARFCGSAAPAPPRRERHRKR